MSSVVDICNLALSHLGDEGTVSAIYPPDGSAQSYYCATYYPISRDSLLSMHSWAFTTRREKLSRVDQTPLDYTYVYSMPADCLKVLGVRAEGINHHGYVDNDYGGSIQQKEKYVIMQQQNGVEAILTDIPNAEIIFSRRVTDTMRFPPLFVESLAYLLASKLAGSIYKGVTGIKVADAMLSRFNMVFNQATRIDANQGFEHIIKTPTWIEAR